MSAGPPDSRIILYCAKVVKCQFAFFWIFVNLHKAVIPLFHIFSEVAKTIGCFFVSFTATSASPLSLTSLSARDKMNVFTKIYGGDTLWMPEHFLQRKILPIA